MQGLVTASSAPNSSHERGGTPSMVRRMFSSSNITLTSGGKDSPHSNHSNHESGSERGGQSPSHSFTKRLRSNSKGNVITYL